jgi:hypothetical protein
MTLQSTANFPNARCYVLKLHRDALPAQGRLIGRLEHIASGEHVDFASGEALLAWLTRHAAALDAQRTDEGAA